MRLASKVLLVAAVSVCAAAPAFGADATFIAVDNAWRANGTDATTLTIAPGQTVTFSYPSGMDFHNLHFTRAQPECPGLPPGPRTQGWSNDCTFAQAGSYPFVCEIHDGMQGTVVVAVPTPTPTASPDPGPPGATPSPTPTPPAGGGPAPTTTGPAPAGKLEVELARRQKGTRVRGTVRVTDAASRVVVTVRRGRTTAGRWVKRSAARGTVTFSVALNVKTRALLRSARRVKVTVTVALTPPGGRTLRTTAKATVSL